MNDNNVLNKKSIKIIIPIIVLLVLLIVAFIYLREYKYNNYRNKQTYEFYQYFSEQKLEYTAEVSFNKKNVIKSFAPEQYKINYDSIPIYYKDNTKVIFPSQMAIIFPLKKQFQTKIPEFSYVEKINNLDYLTFEDYHKSIDHYIIFDGNSLYFFSDSVKFTIDNEEIVLSPFSFIVATGNSFSYYDYEKDVYKYYDTMKNVIVFNDYYKLNVTDDNLDYFEDKVLLANKIDYLTILK